MLWETRIGPVFLAHVFQEGNIVDYRDDCGDERTQP